MSNTKSSLNNYGYCSLIFGALAIVFIVSGKHALDTRDPRSAVFLEFLDRLGWVYKGPKALVAEVKPSPFLPFTDGSILSMLVWFGVYLSTLAIVFGLWAEYRNEDSLLLSAGVICGILGFYVFHTSVAIVAAVICIFIVVRLRARPQQ